MKFIFKCNNCGIEFNSVLSNIEKCINCESNNIKLKDKKSWKDNLQHKVVDKIENEKG